MKVKLLNIVSEKATTKLSTFLIDFIPAIFLKLTCRAKKALEAGRPLGVDGRPSWLPPGCKEIMIQVAHVRDMQQNSFTRSEFEKALRETKVKYLADLKVDTSDVGLPSARTILVLRKKIVPVVVNKGSMQNMHRYRVSHLVTYGVIRRLTKGPC